MDAESILSACYFKVGTFKVKSPPVRTLLPYPLSRSPQPLPTVQTPPPPAINYSPDPTVALHTVRIPTQYLQSRPPYYPQSRLRPLIKLKYYPLDGAPITHCPDPTLFLPSVRSPHPLTSVWTPPIMLSPDPTLALHLLRTSSLPLPTV